MISLVRSIGHSGHYLPYMTGESERKKNPELVYHVCDNLLSPQLDAHAILESFKYACRGHPNMKNIGVEMMFSPPPQYTKDYSIGNWAELTREYIHELDSFEIKDSDTGKLYSGKTNFENSKYSSYVHYESKSGVPHVHIGMCRVDDDGKTNNDHMIHLRAQWAAERVAIRHGWTTAQQVHEQHVKELNKICEGILKNMAIYSFDDYCAALRSKGYMVSVKEGNTGYAIIVGSSKVKGSELNGRHYTIPNLPKQWAKFRMEEEEEKKKQNEKKPVQVKPKPTFYVDDAFDFTPKPKPETTEQTPKVQTPKEHSQQSSHSANTPLGGYFEPRSGCSLFRFKYDGVEYRRYLPNSFIREIDDEYDYRFFEDVDTHKGLACVIFAGIYAGLMAQAPATGGGGGGQSSGWGRKKDEDEEDWKRRSIALANGIRPKKRKTGIRRS